MEEIRERISADLYMFVTGAVQQCIDSYAKQGIYKAAHVEYFCSI